MAHCLSFGKRLVFRRTSPRGKTEASGSNAKHCAPQSRATCKRWRFAPLPVTFPATMSKAFLHEFDDAPQRRGRAREQQVHEKVDYHLWEMVERVANLFRIYPTERPGSSSSEDEDEDEDEDDDQESVAGFLQTASGMTPSEARLNKQKEELAKAYMGIVIRAFSGRQTQIDMRRLTTVAFACGSGDCSLDPRNGFGMRCWYNATAFTDDVDFEGGTAYGRSTCQKLARADPALALKNADNFCYYIQDTATQTSDSRPEAGPDGSSCPSFASVSHPDRDGDCKCPHSKQCFYEGSLGCPFSYTATKNTYSPAYFTVQCKTCTCETKIETTTTTTTTELAIGAAKSRCPAFAALRTPDREGDCSCYGQMVCTFRGDVGCPYARTRQTGRYSDLYFHSSCSECLCARRPTKPSWKEAAIRCPSSALTRAPDSEGDCHCPRYHLCSYENETGCPVAAGPALHSHRRLPATRGETCISSPPPSASTHKFGWETGLWDLLTSMCA
ncbi:eprA1 [Symbiodinium sp. CCMP2456]|nr:eprA1 [Symbiodinium sp. CCMP2456]